MLIRHRFPLRNSDAPGTPPPSPTTNEPAAPPPLAKVIVTATKTEREIALEEENSRLAATVKQRETEVATVTDEFHRFKKSVEDSKPKLTPKKKPGRLLSMFEED